MICFPHLRPSCFAFYYSSPKHACYLFLKLTIAQYIIAIRGRSYLIINITINMRPEQITIGFSPIQHLFV